MDLGALAGEKLLVPLVVAKVGIDRFGWVSHDDDVSQRTEITADSGKSLGETGVYEDDFGPGVVGQRHVRGMEPDVERSQHRPDMGTA